MKLRWLSDEDGMLGKPDLQTFEVQPGPGTCTGLRCALSKGRFVDVSNSEWGNVSSVLQFAIANGYRKSGLTHEEW